MKNIPKRDHNDIRSTNLDHDRVDCDYGYWFHRARKDEKFPGFKKNSFVGRRLKTIKCELGKTFGRAEVLEFYRRDDIEIETKFIATMIWGHEKPSRKGRDSRGPVKVSKMFADFQTTKDKLEAITDSMDSLCQRFSAS